MILKTRADAPAHDLESRALCAAARLSSLALQHFENLPPSEIKSDRSLVSRADREVEALARVLLSELDPGCVVYGEEEGFGSAPDGFDPDDDPHWVLDPIDGTTAFLSKVPTWSVLLAYVRSGQPVVGVVALPALGEVFSASSGSAATFGPLGPDVGAGVKPAKVCRGSGQEVWSQAYVSYSSPGQFAFRGCEGLLSRLAFSCREFRTTGDAFGYTRVLIGAADMMLDLVAAPYDLAAVEVLARQTPGVVLCAATGRPAPTVYRLGGAALAATPELLNVYLKIVQEAIGSQKKSAECGVDLAQPVQEGVLEPDWFGRLFRFICFKNAVSQESALAPPDFVSVRRQRHVCWRLSISDGADTLGWAMDTHRDDVVMWVFRSGIWERSEEPVIDPMETLECQLERMLGAETLQDVAGVSAVPEGHSAGRVHFIRPLFERPEPRSVWLWFTALRAESTSLDGFLSGLRKVLSPSLGINPLLAQAAGVQGDGRPLHLHVRLEIDEQQELDTVGTDVLRLHSFLSVRIPTPSADAAEASFRFDLGAVLRAHRGHVSPEELGARAAQSFLHAWADGRAAQSAFQIAGDDGQGENP